MTPTTPTSCPTVDGMPTERVVLEMDKKALYAARLTAEKHNISLFDWLSKIAWAEAIDEAAKAGGQNDHLFREEWPGWEEERLALMFGEDLNEAG